MNGRRILVADIETTHLTANFGTGLCAGHKWFDEPEDSVKIISIRDFKGWRRDPTDDSRLFKALYDVWMKADMVVTYFGAATTKNGHDEPFFISKLIEHGLPVLPEVAHVDLWKVARKYLKLHSRRLDVVSEFIGIEDKKTPVKATVWKRAMVGIPADIEYVEDHCRRDVIITDKTYRKLRVYDRTHPRLGGPGQCRYCGSNRLQFRGGAVTRSFGIKYRVQCQSCGGWENRSKGKEEK